MDFSTDKSTVVQMKRRRRFSTEAKAAIVKETEAAEASVTSVAKKHGITTGQIFSWRKKFLGTSSPAMAGGNGPAAGEFAQYQSMLAVIVEQEALSVLATKRLSEEVRSGKGALYNVSCAINNLATATIKLQERRSFLIDRITALETAKVQEDDVEVDLVTERMAEKMCLEAVKARLEEQRQDAARIEMETQSGLDDAG